MKKQLFSILLAVCLIINMLPISAYAEVSPVPEITTFQELKMAIEAAPTADTETVIEIGANIQADSTISISGNRNIVIKSKEGNKYTITRGSANRSDLIEVDGAKLTLKDVIVDGNATNVNTTSSMVYMWSGEFIMDTGACIQNAKSDVGGNTAGIFITEDSNMTMKKGAEILNIENTSTIGYGSVLVLGTLNMEGGSIVGCKGLIGSGVAISSEGTVNISGGSITGNKGEYGGLMNRGKLIVSGESEISGNMKDDGTDCNVYMEGGSITVGADGLINTASIGVTTQNPPSQNNPIDITTVGNQDWSGYFTSDNGDYIIQNTGSDANQVLQLVVPVYTVTYNGNGASTGSVSMQTTKVGTTTTVSINRFEKNNYTFTGWNTSTDGNGTAYAENSSIPSQSSGTNIVLYAQWKKIVPTIGEIPTQPVIITGSNLYDTLIKPTIINNGFEILSQGWQSSPNGSSDWVEIPSTSICTTAVNGHYLRYCIIYRSSANESMVPVFSPNTVQISINRYTPTLMLEVTPASPQISGTTMTLKASISGGAPVMTNQDYLNMVPIVFKDGTTTLGSAIISASTGIATFEIKISATGEHYFTAEFTGDSAYNASATSNVVQYTIIADPDIATVETAKTAAENASYNDMTQEDATNEEAIIAALKSAAEIAVNNNSVTVEVNQVSYLAPVAGTSANPDGTNGSYTFTITVSEGSQSQITSEKTIEIKATAYTGVTDVQAVEAAKAAIITAIANLTVSNTTIDRDILTAAQNASLHGVTVAWDTTKGFNKTNATSTVTGTIQGTIILSFGSVTCTVEVNKTIPKVSFEDGGSSSDNNNVSTPVKTEGKIEKDQKQDENAPVTSLNDSSEDLKSKILSAEELAQVATGKDAKIILKVKDISTSVSKEDKKQIEEKLAEEQQNTAKTELLYIDISLFKQIGEDQETRVTKTSGKISISIEIPKDMRSTMQGVDRMYYVIRIHNGVAERLSGTYDQTTNLFTFETDRFSTYALTYKDVNTTTDILTVYNDFYHLRLKAEGAKTSQKLTYVNVAGADGYLIYGAKCGQSLKKIADVKGTVLSYTVKNLKQATYYKYQVKAYKIVDGEKVIISTSKVVHSITEDKTYANPSKVTADVTSIKLSVGNTRTVTCQVVLPKGKKLKEHTANTRYESTNKEIATINSNGKITAKGKGTCYLYVYAQNGVYVKIKLTVK